MYLPYNKTCKKILALSQQACCTNYYLEVTFKDDLR